MAADNDGSSGNKSPEYIRFIGLGFQMMTIIALGTWAGYYVDQLNSWNFPVWLLTGCLLSIGVAFYQLFNNLPKDNSGSK